jgi:predicted DNA-binding helix-hairpin-helix protein
MMRRCAAAVVLCFSVIIWALPACATQPLDLNTATADEIKALPGIGNPYYKSILKGRPYKRRYELVQKKILPLSTYDRIKDFVAAEQDKHASATSQR